MTLDEIIEKAKIVRSGRRTMCIQIKNDSVIIRIPYSKTDEDAFDFLKKHLDWVNKYLQTNNVSKPDRFSSSVILDLKKKAYEIIPRKVEYYANKLSVSYGKISIRCQKTLWGSCTSKRNLSFNCLLMLMPDEVVDSVVCHELCHILELNHSSRFYKLLLSVYPNYYECKRWLKENGRKLSDKI